MFATHRARTRLKEELEKACSFYRDAYNVLCCDRKSDPEVIVTDGLCDFDRSPFGVGAGESTAGGEFP
jgi:hypothetical protein